ncbi:polysaccharide biosynthesis C-terminal domain-containing protein [Bradyrhizobium sediminis]|uniref:Polysaccharide biosynthesis C-terminal domain-containing protein n=1 Tax=Bradyrhizobium sediminis TaxID=2840469 RepID=A0A975RWH2_9BRAD|nr:polysaccharide biosynthesis C-terminal domain-containing protein [Bradyrhizobium sediminis]QWG22740.1 polysaccharide biosynthesis C-terminal domain-containing protein [Bradyrhizobium sediminis]
MLIGQASINLSANILSALLGLLSVFIFTRLFSPHDYGIYLLGLGFAAVVSVFLAGWFRNFIMSAHARDDGSDVRGLVVSGYLVGCLAAPAAYGLGRLVGLDAMEALAAVVLAVVIGVFELTQDLVRARLMVITAMKATLVRASGALCLGVAAAYLGRTGILLLVSATLAYLLAVLVQRSAWRGTALKFDGAGLLAAAKQGLPLTLSLTLLAISSVADRFIIANLVGTADAGKYIAGLDLVRQTLMMPAFSIAAVFVPLAIRINANQGAAAAQLHLGEGLELLLSVTLPACLGFAVISSHIANVVLGVDFRAIAAETMPIVAAAVIFQILTQQYLHTSFLLSGHSSFYLINTASIIVVNVILSYALISGYGTIGAAWARLGADLFGFVCALILSRRAFPIPFPLRRLAPTVIAALVMALVVAALDRSLHVSDLTACVVLAGAGLASYLALCWLLDISRARGRLKVGFALFRTKLANINIG